MANNNWAIMHPGELATPSCRYYSSLMQKIKDRLSSAVQLSGNKLDPEFCANVASAVTGYLEDLSSDFGIWATFRSLCREKYGKTLPFYDSKFRPANEEYDDECINFDDVRFIVWMELSICGYCKGIVYSPISDAVEYFANIVYDIIAEAWDEDSPMSASVTLYIDLLLNSDDWIKVRELALWLAERCYLTRIYHFFDMILSEVGSIDSKQPGLYPADLQVYMGQISYALTKPLRPLGITSLQYLAALAKQKGFPEAVKRLEDARSVGIALYNVIEYEGDVATLQCVRRGTTKSPYIGEILKLDANSLKSRRGLKKGASMMASMVKWNGLYNINGAATIMPEAIPEETEPFYGGIPQQKIEYVEEMRKYSAETIEKNKGSRFVFFDKLETAENIIGQKIENFGVDLSHGAVMYLGDTGEKEISTKAQMSLKSKRNPFYSKKAAVTDGLAVLSGDSQLDYDAIISAIDEGMLADVCITASQGNKVGLKLVQDNIYFFADFFHSEFGSDDV